MPQPQRPTNPRYFQMASSDDEMLAALLALHAAKFQQPVLGSQYAQAIAAAAQQQPQGIFGSTWQQTQNRNR